MNVVCAIDESYAQHCGAMLCSLFANNRGVRFTVFALGNSVSRESRDKLDVVTRAFGQEPLQWQVIDLERLRHAPVSGHVSLATYFRILIPEILRPDIEKVLFLDSDIIVRRSIASLYDQPLDGYTHAAVENPFGAEHAIRLGLPSPAYFNAGVLLLNLRLWREQRLSHAVLEYVEANRAALLWWDQDALNAVLSRCWRRCCPTWNAQEAVFKGYSAADLGMTTPELVEARTDPHVVHFTGSLKPWRYYYEHPFKQDYYRYLAMTPWAGYRPPDTPTLPARLRAMGGMLAPEFVKPGYRRLAAALRSVSSR